MFLLRRSAARAIGSAPTKSLFVKPRSITTATYTPAFRSRQAQWSALSFQKRFNSDEPIKKVETDVAETAAETAAAEAESFAQTTPEAPIEENLTPAQESAQADPMDASHTVGHDALAAASMGRTSGDKPRSSMLGKEPSPPNKTLYVGNLYYEVTEDQLKRVFSRFGEVKSVKIVYDNRGMSRGFAYVEFENLEDSKSAIENLDMQVFEGRNLVVQYHREKRDKPKSFDNGPAVPTKTLFIGNMSYEMSDKDLNDMFRDIRNVMDVRVAIDRRTGQPRGFAHADFVDVASATIAKEVLEGKTIYGRTLRIDFSKSTDSTERRAPMGDRPRGDRPQGDRPQRPFNGERREPRERREPFEGGERRERY